MSTTLDLEGGLSFNGKKRDDRIVGCMSGIGLIGY